MSQEHPLSDYSKINTEKRQAAEAEKMSETQIEDNTISEAELQRKLAELGKK